MKLEKHKSKKSKEMFFLFEAEAKKCNGYNCLDTALKKTPVSIG